VIFISVDDSHAFYFVLAPFLCWSAAKPFVGLGFGPKKEYAVCFPGLDMLPFDANEGTKISDVPLQ
jgi:hypothetical protein